MSTDVGFKKTAEAEHHYSTGMQRDNRVGKGALHWLPWDAVRLVSTIYEHGNKGRSNVNLRPNKDGKDRNWENGGDIDDFYQSALNHISAFLAGDRSEAHIPQAIWNLLNGLQMSIWVYLGYRSQEHNTLTDARHGWKPGDPYVSVLAPIEIERLKFFGVIPKDYEPAPSVNEPESQPEEPTPAPEPTPALKELMQEPAPTVVKKNIKKFEEGEDEL